MKPEQALWSNVGRPLMVELGLDPYRVENVVGAGTPDVNYTFGWIELKHEPDFPVRASTPVTIHTLKARKFQVPWLTSRWLAGGLAWLLIRVKAQLFLFAAPDARDIRRGLPRAEFEQRAVWKSKPNGRLTAPEKADLRRWLVGEVEGMRPGDRAKFHRLKCNKTWFQVAAEMGVSVEQVIEAEAADDARTDDLLAFFEN